MFSGFIWMMWIASVISNVSCELFAIKNGGDVGFFDGSENFNLLFRNQKAIHVTAQADTIWLINKFNAVTKYDTSENRWMKIRKSMLSLTRIALKKDLHFVFGVNKKGNIFVRDDYKNKDFVGFHTPIMTPSDVNKRVLDEINMKPKVDGKILQLSAFKDNVYGRDELGNLWKFSFNEKKPEWVKITPAIDAFKFKWIDAVPKNTLFVINEVDNKPYKVDLKNNKYELISDENDFEQVVYDFLRDIIYGLNYYKQLFYFDADDEEWVLIDDDVDFISFGMTQKINQIKKEL